MHRATVIVVVWPYPGTRLILLLIFGVYLCNGRELSFFRDYSCIGLLLLFFGVYLCLAVRVIVLWSILVYRAMVIDLLVQETIFGREWKKLGIKIKNRLEDFFLAARQYIYSDIRLLLFSVTGSRGRECGYKTKGRQEGMAGVYYDVTWFPLHAVIDPTPFRFQCMLRAKKSNFI